MKIGELAQRTNNRKAKEDVLKASEQRFRDLVNTTDGIVWEADARTFQFTFISEKAVKLLGFPAADWLEPGFWISRLHPEDATWAPEFCASCTGRLEPHDFNYRFIAQDGRTVWLHDIVTVVAEQGAPRWLRGIMVDVTAHKQAEIAIQTSRDRLNAVLQTTIDGYWLVDLKGRIIDVNDAAVKMLGYTREALLQLGPNDIDAIDTPTDIEARIERMLKSGGERFETRHRTRSGEIIDVEVSITLLPDHSALVVFVRDITERKQADLLITQSEQRLELAVGGAGLGLWDWRASAGDLTVNDRWRSMLGLDPAGPMPTIDLWHSLVHVDDLPKLDQLFKDVIMNPTGRDFEIEIRARHQDGHYLWIFDKGHVAERAADGSPLRVVGTHLDISARKSAEEALRHTQALLAMAEKIGRVGGWEIDTQTRQTTWTKGVYDIYELDGTDRLTVDEGINYYTPESQPIIEQAVRCALEQGKPFDLELEIITAKGNRRSVHTMGETDLTRGKVSGFFQDITERKRAEESLQQAAAVFGHTREGITITNRDGTILDVNEAFTRITGYSREDAIGQNPKMLNSGKQGAQFYKEMWDALTAQGYWSGEVWNRRKDGVVYAELLSISAIRDELGVTQQYVALFSDITAIKAHQSQLEHMAHFDALTSLPNRLLLADRLQQAMTQAQRRSRQLAVAYLDLDGFKSINDRHGHELGDQVLIALASRMKDCLREGDTLARLGGDEFVAVLIDLEDASDSVPLLNRLLAAAALVVPVGELSVQVSASLGVTFYPLAQDIDADQLLRQADQAMYQAKLAGKNRYHVFDAAHDSSIRVQHESLERIRLALALGEFVLHYQPKVNMHSGTVIGAEALIRWQHPQKGLLAPMTFLPAIEDHPLAVEVGEWVIDAAMHQMETWDAAGLDLPVSVNIGARQLQQADFVARLQAIHARHPQVRPGCIELEILETSALADMAQVSLVIEDCAKLGMKFALDDFGTGYSSLTYLKRLRVATLKIDQSFVRDMLVDPDDLAILQGVIGLAAAFKREVIAEGVETIAHGTVLLQLGCELAQGYGIARPMPPELLPAWAAAWQPDAAWGRVRTSAEVSRSADK